MCERLRPGDTAVDVGCFKGAYTYWMRRCVGAAGSVVGVRAAAGAGGVHCAEMVAGMKWRNVSVEAAGVSDAVGTAEVVSAGVGA